MVEWPDAGIATGKFLLPEGKNVPSSWPVVACDQFTSQPQYWERAEEIIGDCPSTLHLILPEAFLNNSMLRAAEIHANMRDYLARGIIRQAVDGMVLTARTTASGTRLGLVLCLDLEQYDYTVGSTSLIRATEGTVESRIPPRLSIRQDALLELSHIMVLADDVDKTVIEPVFSLRSQLRMLYDVELMQGGGHLSGWAVEEEGLLSGVYHALRSLQDKKSAKSPLLAVGDGNHSLAAARAHWLKIRSSLQGKDIRNHPARFAMAELTNLQDEALRFEPIHRILYNTEADAVLQMLRGAGAVDNSDAPDVTVVTREGDFPFMLTRSLHLLAVGTIQQILDGWITKSVAAIDYIHGENALRELVAQRGAVGIILPSMDKSLLFPAVTAFGPLPRKTFSMGDAHEKRYYMEARKIVK
jgi:hypothetical protein